MQGGPELWLGLGWGVVVAAAVAVSRLRFRDAPPPVAGLALAIAGCLALESSGQMPVTTLIGLALLALGAAVAMLARLPTPAWPLALAPGAWAVLEGNGGQGLGFRLAVFASIAMGGGLVAEFDRPDEHLASGPGLALCSAAGLYLTVPDTESALAVLGATVPIAALGWPLRWARLGRVGAPAWVGLFAYVAVTGGSSRPSSILGGIGCLGVLVLEPASRTLSRSARELEPWRRKATENLLFYGAIHFLFVLTSARVAGLLDSLAVAAGILIVAVALALVTLWATRPRH